MIIVMVVVIAVLYGTGTYLLLQRNLSRIVIGLGLLGHGANLMLLMAGGRAGEAPRQTLGAPLVGRLPGPEAGVNVKRPAIFAVGWAILAVVCASLPVGCSPGGGSRAEPATRDSAGVRIVENAVPEDTCAVASAPDLERPAALIRWSGGDSRVRPEHVEAYRQGWLERAAAAEEPLMRRSREAQASKDRPVVDRFPAHREIRIGLEGDIWVRMYPRPAEDDPGWLVFGPDGRLACRAFLPFETAWDLYEIGSDHVLGKMRDEVDVEHVRRFPLRRARG